LAIENVLVLKEFVLVRRKLVGRQPFGRCRQDGRQDKQEEGNGHRFHLRPRPSYLDILGARRRSLLD
jgi:hypothetical protein